MMLPMAALPAGLLLIALVWKRSGAALNPVLGGTAAMYMLYTVLAAIGLVMGRVYHVTQP
jgi:hypothetical protein